jgi:soluble lytic murein transglycosylase-like protein
MRLAVSLFLLVCPALAGEYAILASGLRLHIDRHEKDGSKVRLYNGEGTTEMDASNVVGFEQEEAAAAPVAAAPAAARAASPRELVDAAAEKYNLPKEFLHGVVKAESNYLPHAVSPKGAIGLMQLMPETARRYGVDPLDPAQNVEAGARYLSELLIKYDYAAYRALAAYNAGPGAVARYGGVPPYRETIEYIRRVMRNYQPAAN